jgi:hypothetical protein
MAGGAGWFLTQRPAITQRPIGLFTSLPILWSESETLGDLLHDDNQQHWANAVITGRGPVVPLDTLEALRPDLTRLVIAQPRPLSPAENVALDAWVRGGGRLLLIADPALTAETAYSVGDPRRPQDLVLLSPILSRWGLELVFDDTQGEAEREVAVLGEALPTRLSGAWRGQRGNCRIEAQGLLAECQIGRGRVLALADAEVLAQVEDDGKRPIAFAGLLDHAFADE